MISFGTNYLHHFFEELYSLYCTGFLRDLESLGSFIKRKETRRLIQTHHIQPRFAGGDESPANRINVGIYHHGLAHMIRFLYTNNVNDLAGLNSLLRTIEEINATNQARIDAQQRVLGSKPRGRPFQPGNVPKKKAPTAAQLVAGSLADKANQAINSYESFQFLKLTKPR